MSSDTAPLDPYRSPSLPEGPYAGKTPSGRPGWLTALCVLCIVLGALGLLNAVLGTAIEVAGPAFQQAMMPKGGNMPDDFQQAQQDLMDEINAIKKKHLLSIYGLLAFKFIAATLLLVGGLRCLSLGETGRKLLIIGCGVALAFELTQAIVQSLIQMENLTAMNSAVEKFQSSLAGNNSPPGMKNVLKWSIRISTIVPIVLQYVMAAVKGGLFIFGLIYLQRARIKALFK